MSKHRTPRQNSMGSIANRISDEQALRLAATSRPRSRFTAPPRAHAGDVAVDLLAGAMKARLPSQHDSGNWSDPRQYSTERLAQMLGDAVIAGHAVDIANVAAVLHARGVDSQTLAAHALRALVRGSREVLAVDAARYRKLRDVPAEQLGAPGVPCIAVAGGATSLRLVNDGDADAAVDGLHQDPQ